MCLFSHRPHRVMQEPLGSAETWEPRLCQERKLTMLYNLIQCRSLTHAQRTSAALERAGIPNRVIRSPKAIAREGCSHSVRISQQYLSQALELLSNAGLAAKRVFVTAGDEHYEEVEL